VLLIRGRVLAFDLNRAGGDFGLLLALKLEETEIAIALKAF